MDLFDQPRKVKKVPSPLLHLPRDDQKDGDDPPEPEFKHPNAPPVAGAIYRGPRDENVSTAIVGESRSPNVLLLERSNIQNVFGR
jgi:hypothetical protein